jgi:hypothetical protein
MKMSSTGQQGGGTSAGQSDQMVNPQAETQYQDVGNTGQSGSNSGVESGNQGLGIGSQDKIVDREHERGTSPTRDQDDVGGSESGT